MTPTAAQAEHARQLEMLRVCAEFNARRQAAKAAMQVAIQKAAK